jgi:hypothetical protein
MLPVSLFWVMLCARIVECWTPGFICTPDLFPEVVSLCRWLIRIPRVSVRVSNLDVDPEEPVGVKEGRVGRRTSTRFFEVDEDIDKYLDWEVPLDDEYAFTLDANQTIGDASAPDIGQATEYAPVTGTCQVVGSAQVLDMSEIMADVSALGMDQVVEGTPVLDAGQTMENAPALAAIEKCHARMYGDATSSFIDKIPLEKELLPFREFEQVPPSREKEAIHDMLLVPRPIDAPATQVLASASLQIGPADEVGASLTHLKQASQKRPAVDDPNINGHATKIPKSAIPNTQAQKLVLSKVKSEELKRRKRTRRSKGKQGGRRKRKDVISCECGHKADDFGGTICCDGCNAWQHAQCYGFKSEEDPRIPDIHCCYTCLLGFVDDDLLGEMKKLAFFRRTLCYVWQVDKFPTTIEVFAAELRMRPNANHSEDNADR